MSKHETYKHAIEKYGIEPQLRQLQEECAELIVAINHYCRDNTKVQGIIEEIADTEIMIEQMRLHFSSAMIDAIKEIKIERLEERIRK